MNTFGLLLAGLALLVVAALVARAAFHNQRETGLPASYKVVYSDSGAWEKVAEPLFSSTYGLTGKPDYIVRSGRQLVPVELKPLRQAEQPYESDIMQLAAYCLLLEDVWNKPPPYGLLRYKDQTFKIEWSEQLRAALLMTLDDMRVLARFPARQGELMPQPNHDMTARCRSCGFQYICFPE